MEIKKLLTQKIKQKLMILKDLISPKGQGNPYHGEISLLKYFLDFTSIKKNILEVGMRYSKNSLVIELYKQGFEVEGVDASKDMA